MADCPIMKLTDDCLINLFTYLTNVRDKLRLELVCIRFARLAVKQSSWKGSEKLTIEINSHYWADLSTDSFFCEINELKLPLVHFNEGLHSILTRTDIHYLNLEWKPYIYEAMFRIKAAFEETFAQMLSIMTSCATRLKLLSFSYDGRIEEFRPILQIIKHSYASLKKLEYSALLSSREEATTMDEQFWACVSQCQSLEVFISNTHSSEYSQRLNGEVVHNSLMHKPLRELNITFPHRLARESISYEQYATICNNVSGSGITHLTVQSTDNLGAFLTQLNENSRLALVELKCLGLECNMEMVLSSLPRIGYTLPNFRQIVIEVDSRKAPVKVTEVMLQNAVIGFFNGFTNSGPSRKLELNSLAISDIEQTMFKDLFVDRCIISEIQVTFLENKPEGRHWAIVLEKGNTKLIMHQVQFDSVHNVVYMRNRTRKHIFLARQACKITENRKVCG